MESNFFVIKLWDYNEDAITIEGTTYDANSAEVEDLFDEGVELVDVVIPPFSCIIDERQSTTNKKLEDRIFFSSNPGTLLTVSKKAKDALERLDLPVEFYELNIKGKNVTINEYFIVNVIGKIECVDFEKSDVEINEVFGYINAYKSLVLNEDKIPPHTDIFLLGENISKFVIVSKRLKNAIEAAELTGFIFVKPEDYSNYDF